MKRPRAEAKEHLSRKPAIVSKWVAVIPRVVMAQLPKRTPPGVTADLAESRRGKERERERGRVRVTRR
jgi:hypothetical protein